MVRPSLHQILVLGTAAVVLAAMGAGYWYKEHPAEKIVSIDIDGQPTEGSLDAKISMVVFEDFQCATCQKFNIDILPQVKAEFIDSGRMRCTLVPLAFIDGSEILANAALAVYAQSPERFFPFADELFRYLQSHPLDPIESTILILIADQVGVIDLTLLRRAIQDNRYAEIVRQNFFHAEKIMGRHFGTPAIFINGVRVPPMSFRTIQHQIQVSESK